MSMSPRDGTRPTRILRTSAWIAGPVPSPGGLFNGLLALARGSKPFSHPNQIGERFRAHFLHDVGAMKFDRSLGGSEFAGDLFIQQSGCNERHHFALTRGELFITLPQFSGFSSLL